jgi:hypothetical protein
MSETKVPWGDIPDFSLLPAGIFQFAIKELLPYNKAENGKLIVKATHEVVEPANFAGQTMREFFAIGSDDDPQAEDPETWKRTIGARNLKRLLERSKAEMFDDLDETCKAAVGAEFCATVEVETQQKGEYAGRKNNRINAVYEAGQVTPQVASAPPRAAAPAKAAARPAPAAAPRTIPRATRLVDPPAVDEEEEIEVEEEEAPPVRTARRPPVGGRAAR